MSCQSISLYSYQRKNPFFEDLIAKDKIYEPLPLRKKCSYSEFFWSAFFSHFPAFGLNTERYGVSFRIQSECGKNADQINSEVGHVLHSVTL